MWKPVDPFGLPSPEDAVHAKEAISQLEDLLESTTEQIRQLQRQMRAIKDDLRDRRAWLAPVRKLNFDVLCSIFEFCGEEDWGTPLQIGAVSRLWREAVLATPRAWSFMIIREPLALRYMELFFQRSNLRLLHIGIDHHHRVEELLPVVHRIQYLCIYSLYPSVQYYIWHKLQRLSIHTDQASTFLSYFTVPRFPSLRHLRLSGTFIRDHLLQAPGMIQDLVPLESLALVTGRDLVWIDTLRSFQKNLLSLELTISERSYALHEETIHLPRLRFLEVIDRTHRHCTWALYLKAPVLESFVEMDYPRPGSPRVTMVNESKIANMRIFVERRSFLLPHTELKRLQLQGGLEAANLVLVILLSDRRTCPNLQLIELCWIPSVVDPNTVVKKLIEYNSQRCRPLRIQFVYPWPDLPGALGGSGHCGDIMPCYC